MRRNTIRSSAMTVLLATAILVAAPRHGVGAQVNSDQRIDEIRHALLRLPYYGPFDALSFSYDKGTVTLSGYAYALGLKADAERAVKRVTGVDTVVNNIEQLPASRNDDELRWRTFYAIYTNDFLSRYAPGGGLWWGHRDHFRREMALGMEPIGSYPIAIVVKNGRIQLMGMVDNQADRTAAELAARGVPGSFGVENRLEVHKTT